MGVFTMRDFAMIGHKLEKVIDLELLATYINSKEYDYYKCKVCSIIYYKNPDVEFSDNEYGISGCNNLSYEDTMNIYYGKYTCNELLLRNIL
jgi:hypothetical protein